MNAMEHAIALRAEARLHHREAGRHRRQAKELMEQLRTFCEANGIPIEYVVVQEDRDNAIRSD